MSSRRATAFVEALLADRRPKAFRVESDEAAELRAAVSLRAARPGSAVPDERFVAELREELAEQVRETTVPVAPSPITHRQAAPRRSRVMLGAAAVAAVVGGSVAATTTIDHILAAGPQAHAGSATSLLRVGKFESTSGRTVGQLVAYRGSPSWVFMSIRDPGMNGKVDCRIQMTNGRTAASGTVVVRNGVGEFARTTSVDVSRFRGATLVSATGVVLARASFAQ